MWVKPLHYLCASEFQEGQVTEIINPQSVVVDRVPCHVNDLQTRMNTSSTKANGDESSGDIGYIILLGWQTELDDETTQAHAGDCHSSHASVVIKDRGRCGEYVTKQRKVK